MVGAAEGYEVVDVGGSPVGRPRPEVMHFRLMRRLGAEDASPVSYGRGQPLVVVGYSSGAAQPEGLAVPAEDHPAEFGVRSEMFQDAGGHRPRIEYLA